MSRCKDNAIAGRWYVIVERHLSLPPLGIQRASRENPPSGAARHLSASSPQNFCISWIERPQWNYLGNKTTPWARTMRFLSAIRRRAYHAKREQCVANRPLRLCRARREPIRIGESKCATPCEPPSFIGGATATVHLVSARGVRTL